MFTEQLTQALALGAAVNPQTLEFRFHNRCLHFAQGHENFLFRGITGWKQAADRAHEKAE